MKILRKKDVVERAGVSRSVLHELIKKGAFPAPVRLSARRVGWLEHEINAWIEARIADRDSAGLPLALEPRFAKHPNTHER